MGIGRSVQRAVLWGCTVHLWHRRSSMHRKCLRWCRQQMMGDCAIGGVGGGGVRIHARHRCPGGDDDGAGDEPLDTLRWQMTHDRLRCCEMMHMWAWKRPRGHSGV